MVLFFIVFALGFLLNFLLIKVFVFINLLENSTNKSTLGIIIANPKGKYLFINKSAKTILNIEEQEMVSNLDFSKIIKKQKSLNIFLNKTFLSEEKSTSEIYLSNGNIIRVNVQTIKSPLNLLLAFYIQITDLTQVLISDRAKTLAHSIQKVAHEIKTPLSSVLLSLDSLEQSLTEESKNELVKDDFNIAREEIDRIKKFINGFLKFANMSGTQLNSCNLKELIENSLLRFSTYLSNGIEVKIDINDDINVMVDSYQMEEVFQVLTENSIDAMQGKGKIIISASKESNGKVPISIRDNGIGINEEQLPSIFQPYMTTKKDGTGMGLAIAKKILEDHGSEIIVNSRLGKGTEFSFGLRISKNEK